MFNAAVTPVMFYGSSVWGFSKQNDHAEMIQNRAIRYVLGVNRFTPLPALTGEMGWSPTKDNKYINMLQLWNRLIKMSSDRLTKWVFNVDYEKASVNRNWCSDVRDIFCMIGELSVYNEKTVCDIAYCKEKLKEQSKVEWEVKLNAKLKLRTYRKYKCEMCPEKYVNIITNRQDRSLLAKFRAGILQLHIETGRYNGTKLEDRLCNMCDDNSVEDELHFLCICPFYNNVRKAMYENVSALNLDFPQMSNDQKFIELMSNHNLKVCKYLKVAWEKRREALYK